MERSRQMTLLCYCVQIDLPVQLEIETVYSTCFMLVKQAGSLSRFHVFLRSFVLFHMLLWESPLLLRDVTGEAVLEPGAVWCWFCVTTFTKSLIRLNSLSQPMLRRGSSGPPTLISIYIVSLVDGFNSHEINECLFAYRNMRVSVFPVRRETEK